MALQDDLYNALQKADAAGDTAGAKQIADYIRSLPISASPASTVSDDELAQFRAQGFNGTKEDLAKQKADFAATNGQHSYGAQFSRDVPVGAMQGMASLADAANVIGNPGAAVLRYFDPNSHVMQASHLVGQADQAMAAPSNTPQTGTQRVVSGVTRALAGTAATAGVGAAVGGPTSFLAASPGLQMTSAATGATAGGLTREAGGGKGAQIIASIIGGLAPGAAKYAAERVIGAPSAAAQTLQGAGIDNLTPGQQNAGGAYSQIEDASTHLPFVGSQFQKAKEAAQQQAKEAFILQTAAPGAKVQPTGDLQQTLTDVGKTFEPAYDSVSGFPLRLKSGQPVIMNQGTDIPLSSAFNQVVANKGILATNETRQQANDFLSNLLTLPVKNSEDLIAMRSAIRSETSGLAADGSMAARGLSKILNGAEQKVTDALESQLPPQLMQNLQAVDAQYAKYKVAVDTMVAAKDRPGGFTFSQASDAAARSAKNALGKDAYAKGEGFMRDIPTAAQEVFKVRPPTGASLTAQAASYPLLPYTSFMSLTNTGRGIAANNQLNPMNFAPSAMNSLIAPQLPDARNKLSNP